MHTFNPEFKYVTVKQQIFQILLQLFSIKYLYLTIGSMTVIHRYKFKIIEFKLHIWLNTQCGTNPFCLYSKFSYN